KQGNVADDHSLTAGAGLLEEDLAPAGDRGMDDRFDVGACGGLVEDELAEPPAVQLSIRCHGLRPEPRDDCRELGCAGLLDVADDAVGINDHRAPFPEQLSDLGLPGGDVSGEGEGEHGYQLSAISDQLTST